MRRRVIVAEAVRAIFADDGVDEVLDAAIDGPNTFQSTENKVAIMLTAAIATIFDRCDRCVTCGSAMRPGMPQIGYGRNRELRPRASHE
jgi:hypothetical protein